MRRSELRKILGNTFKPVDLSQADQYGRVAGYIVLVQGAIHRHEMNIKDANKWVKRLRAQGVSCEAVRADDPRFYQRKGRSGRHANTSKEETARAAEEASGQSAYQETYVADGGESISAGQAGSSETHYAGSLETGSDYGAEYRREEGTG